VSCASPVLMAFRSEEDGRHGPRPIQPYRQAAGQPGSLEDEDITVWQAWGWRPPSSSPFMRHGRGGGGPRDAGQSNGLPRRAVDGDDVTARELWCWEPGGEPSLPSGEPSLAAQQVPPLDVEVAPPPLHAPAAYGPQVLELWAAAAGPLKAIAAHPFLEGLVDGTLDMVKFRRYIRQDSLYLERFARALALLASRAPALTAVGDLASFASNCSAGERLLHAGFIAAWDAEEGACTDRNCLAISPADLGERSPACELYTGWLLAAAAVEPFPVALTAILPCHWVYLYIGKLLLDRRAEHDSRLDEALLEDDDLPHAAPARDAAYDKWIDTYAGREFEAAVVRCLALVETAAVDAPEHVPAMVRMFRRGCELEFLFWDSAWILEEWRDFSDPRHQEELV